MAVHKIAECFDDPMSVFERNHNEKMAGYREEMLDPKTDTESLISRLTPDTVPFTYDELERMMKLLEKATPNNPQKAPENGGAV